MFYSDKARVQVPVFRFYFLHGDGKYENREFHVPSFSAGVPAGDFFGFVHWPGDDAAGIGGSATRGAL